MIRLIQRRLIVPRGDTGTFSIPVLAGKDTGDVSIFTVFDPLMHRKIFEKVMTLSGETLTMELTHGDTVNLPVGQYVWDIKFYTDPIFAEEKLIGGTEVDSYYAAFTLPVCEIRETGDNLLMSDDAPTGALKPGQIDFVTASINEMTSLKNTTTIRAAEADTSAQNAANSAQDASVSAQEALDSQAAALVSQQAAQTAAENAQASATLASQKAAEIGANLESKANIADLATVAFSGNYNDLSNKPTIPEVPVQDVQINNISIVDNGIANIPIADIVYDGGSQQHSTYGISKYEPEYGISVSEGSAFIVSAAETQVKAGTHSFRPITPFRQHLAVFYGLAKAAGHDEKNSNLSLGQYTSEAKTAIQQMLDVPSTNAIPTQVSQLTNDAGYLTSFTETDPTVPAWAKAQTKPTYTAAEVGAPTVQEMNSAISTAIGNVNSFDMAVVQELPTQDISTHTVYLVPKTGETNDVYNEYVYINNAWEMIGNTQIDLSNYATKNEVTALIDDTAGVGDTDKVVSADKYATDHSTLLNTINQKYDDSNLNANSGITVEVDTDTGKHYLIADVKRSDITALQSAINGKEDKHVIINFTITRNARIYTVTADKTPNELYTEYSAGKRIKAYATNAELGMTVDMVANVQEATDYYKFTFTGVESRLLYGYDGSISGAKDGSWEYNNFEIMIASDINPNYDANFRKIESLEDPTNSQDAVTKNYVDTHAVSVPDLVVTFTLAISGGVWTATSDKTVSEIVAVFTAGKTVEAYAVQSETKIALTTKNSSATSVRFYGVLQGGYPHLVVSISGRTDSTGWRVSVTKSLVSEWSDDYYNAGDSRISYLGDPTDAQDAATKGYVDTALSNKEDKAGLTVTFSFEIDTDTDRKIFVASNSPSEVIAAIVANKSIVAYIKHEDYIEQKNIRTEKRDLTIMHYDATRGIVTFSGVIMLDGVGYDITITGSSTNWWNYATTEKLSAPSTPGTVGQVLTSDGQGGQSWQTPSGGTVTDVQVNGQSVLSDGVANIPYATDSRLGVIKTGTSNGIYVDSTNGEAYVSRATDAQIKASNGNYRPITPTIQHQSVFYGLAKAAGDSTQAASNNAIGTYTDEAKEAIQQMLDVPSTADLAAKLDAAEAGLKVVRLI